MTSLGIKCVKDTMSAPLLEQGLSATDCLLENGKIYADICTHRAERTRKICRAFRAGTMMTVLCVGLVLLYHNCNIINVGYGHGDDAGMLPADDTGHLSSNGDIEIDMIVNPNSDDVTGRVDGITYPLAETSFDGKCNADPKYRHARYRSEISSSHTMFGLPKKSGVDSGLQQGHTHEPRSAQSGKGKTPLYPQPGFESDRSLESDEDPSVSLEGTSTPPQLIDKVIPYATAVKKGKAMQKLLDQPNESKDSGKTFEYADLERNGWRKEKFTLAAPPEVDKIMRAIDPEFMQHPSDRSHQKHSRVSQNKGVFGPKENPKTDAYYKQYFEPDSGVIFALENYGPEEMGMTKVPPVTKSRLPTLRHWSDVVFLEWMARTENDLTAKTGLQKIVRCEISTPSTIKIIQQILQDMKHDQNKPITYESRISIRRPTGKQSNDAFYALLGTQNGYGIAYLLSQHKMSLGLKFVESIDIWYAEGYFYLMFNIQNDPRSKVAKPADRSGSGQGPVPGGSGTRQKRDHEIRSAPVDKGKSPAHLVPAPPVPAPPHGPGSSSSADTSSTDETESLESFKGRLTYNDAVAKGSKYLQLMKQSNKSKDKSCTEEEAKKQGWVDHSDADIRTPSGISTLLADFAPKFNTPSSLVNSDWRHLNDGKGSWLKKLRPTGASYQQIVNARVGVIFITNTHGPKEEGAKQSPPVTVLPNMQHLSDFSYMAWTEAAQASKRSRKTLRKVFRCAIDNKDTKHIIAQVTNEAQPASLPYSKRMSFKAGSKQYLALLGTENGVGVAYLLAEHQTTMGWKVVDSIEVFYDQGFAYIVFNIRDAMAKSEKSGAAGPSRSKDMHKRSWKRALSDATSTAKKRPLPAESDDDAVPSIETSPHRGLKPLTDGQLHKRWPLQWSLNYFTAERLGERNALDLIDASTPRASSSRWMEVADLRPSRFELTERQSGRTDGLPVASEAVAQIVPALVHMPAPQVLYRVWSRRVHPRLSLSAFHHNNFLLSTAKALRVTGSDQEGAIAWHDVAYLSRLQAVGEGHMRSLKHIIKADTDSSGSAPSLKVVAELLDNSTPSFIARRTYVECTMEFNVLLGIIPGQEVTEFLLTHRETLGMKKVSQISVWYERDAGRTFPVIWYELEDVQEGAPQQQSSLAPIAGPSNSGPSQQGPANPPGWRDASGSRPQ